MRRCLLTLPVLIVEPTRRPLTGTSTTVKHKEPPDAG
jgi:hypothetical protein